ncbi:MAG: PAS domain S-box protein [Deltaproteobacteria bacterium]|nr:PAS domain S-box protein [Deltaproteobacteria bacterium]
MASRAFFPEKGVGINFAYIMVFMSTNRVKKNRFFSIPPWIILGAVIVLAPIFVYMTLEAIHRQNEGATKLLLEKGAALIRSFEAGTRTGMRGMHRRGFRLQTLLTETAQQPDIVYLIVTDTEGTVVAHSDMARIGESHGTGLDLARISGLSEVEWRKVGNADKADTFEVFRRFSPKRRHFPGHRRGMMSHRGWLRRMEPNGTTPETTRIIFVGLDMEPIEAARKEDARHTVIMAIILLLIGFAGMVSLFLAQAYRSAKSSLSRAEAFSDNVVESMPVGLSALDPEARIVSFNQTAESVLGIPAHEALGRKAHDVLPHPLLSITDKLETREGIIGREMDCTTRDGKLIPLDVSATRLQEKSGAFMGHLILFRDLSEIRTLKKEVERSERLASIGRLAAGIAHEIRNPLSSIKGFATYFKERYREVPEDQKTADVLIQEVERLNRVIGQLLEFARPLNLRKQPASLATLIQHSLKVVQGEADKKGVIIHLDDAPETITISLDPDRFQQVLLNLYLNAIESMGEGGSLGVAYHLDEDSDSVVVNISDTGAGIREEDLPHVFDPYFTTKSTGTGLGLAIVHNIVEAHGGQVRVRSRPGQGTTVTISLPFS